MPKYTVAKVWVDAGGYASDGTYYGVPKPELGTYPLYRILFTDEQDSHFFRARDRKSALDYAKTYTKQRRAA